MRNDLMACEGPQQANATSIGRARSHRRRTMRGLLALPLALMLIAPGTALAAEPTSGYSQTTPAPTTTTAPTPKQETAPTKTSSTPKETPAKSGVEPTKTSEPAKSSTEPTATTATKTLPFTGLNLTWIVIGGVLLVAMGASILLTQRRRQGTGR
jgi:cytoskeletal protein RodZ